MLEQSQINWIAEGATPNTSPAAYFLYDTTMGLTDTDFHKIIDENWRNMHADGPSDIARLQVAPNTRAKEINIAIQLILNKGGYRIIEILITPR